MNKLKYFFVLSMIIIASSCIKNADHFTDFSTTTPILELKTAVQTGGNLINIAGLGNFSQASLTTVSAYFPDTISFYVNLASEQTLNRDLHLKVGINQAIRNSYNADTINHPISYEVMPDSLFTWTDQSVTIPAGQRSILLTGLIIDYAKIDPTKNYMLPIAILDGDGIAISGNQGAIYFHAIGNPNAGNYTVVGTRTNYTGSIAGGVIASVVDLAAFSPKSAAPVGPTVIDMNYSNLAPPTHYTFTFNTAGNVLVDGVVNITGVTNLGIDVLTFDFATKTIHVVSHYTNSAGNDRIIEEFLTRQ